MISHTLQYTDFQHESGFQVLDFGKRGMALVKRQMGCVGKAWEGRGLGLDVRGM